MEYDIPGLLIVNCRRAYATVQSSRVATSHICLFKFELTQIKCVQIQCTVQVANRPTCPAATILDSADIDCLQMSPWPMLITLLLIQSIKTNFCVCYVSRAALGPRIQQRSKQTDFPPSRIHTLVMNKISSNRLIAGKMGSATEGVTGRA